MQQALIRLIVLSLALLNQSLTMFGWNPLPFSEEEMYEGLSALFTVIIAFWSWWKNNSVTKEAQKADVYLRNLKDFKSDV